MKNRVNWLLIPAVAVGIGACKKETPTAAERPAASDSKAPEVVPVPKAEPAAPAVGAEERAAKLGFARHLPQDTEGLVSFYNGTKVAERVKASKLWKLVQEQMEAGTASEEEIEGSMEEVETTAEIEIPAPAGEPGEEPAEAPAVDAAEPAAEAVPEVVPSEVPGNPDAETPVEPGLDMDALAGGGPAVLFGSEVTLALGKPTGEQLGMAMNVNRRFSYFQMRALAKALAEAAKSGETAGMEESLVNGYNEELVGEVLKDPESGLATLEKLRMPPLYVAFRTSEADRAGASQQLAGLLQNLMMFGDFVAQEKFEVGTVTFEGLTVVGAKIAEMMKADRTEMDEAIGVEAADKLIAAVAAKNLVIVTGVVGDYVVLFAGGSKEDLRLADSPAGSLAGNPTLSFGDNYLNKDLLALSYGQKESIETIMKSAGGLSDMAAGLRDGLAASEGLGDTKEIQTLLKEVEDREAALKKLVTVESSGSVAFFEEGLKIESYGGVDNGMLDWKSPNKLASLGDSEDVLLFANLTGDAAYDEKGRAYAESLVKTGYAMVRKFADASQGEDGEIGQFKSMAETFETEFRADVVGLWDAFGKDFAGSLGHERAFVIDMKGTSPAIPGLPQTIVDQLKVPRFSLIAPVTDRAKLSGSWDKANTTLTTMLGKVSKMTGQDIPMQKPISSEKNGAVTWFFPMPFFTDDFLPSVTVSDQWFATSTSKNQANDLIAQAKTANGTRTGFWFSLNFRTLERYADETFRLVDANAAELMGAPLEADDRKKIEDALSLLDALDKLTVHGWREGSVLRSTVHFKTR